MAVFITEAGSSKRPMNHHGKKKKGAQGDEEKLLIPA
jgi:hypothetical protein